MDIKLRRVRCPSDQVLDLPRLCRQVPSCSIQMEENDMKALLVPLIIGAVIAVGALTCRLVLSERWAAFHTRALAVIIFAFGVYLATLTGTMTQFVLPGIGAIGLGVVAGGAIGFGTFLVVGAVGLATGGVGLALGAGAMTLIGAGVGAAGGAAGGFGFRVVEYPLVSPFVWAPILMFAVYLFVTVGRNKLEALPPPESPDAVGNVQPAPSQDPH
ncbi:hypothetical protein QTH90_23860 [Variovorax sp. J2P1-59]|uniref:hypothetical protein n=1 Tax=Variovorax flavidus TaxID=3053501 RepID=UPI002578075C|nr:hypothetical protein [Variovorax sp. J2P1-59]MDM0077463.1 hypothetical protein [Variovorax sp. J2P1-59]